MDGKVALVTGASSGIGAQTAVKLRTAGFTVYGAARRVERINTEGVRALSMDVADADSIRAGVDRIVGESGRVDVVVNNAGYGSYGAIEDVPLTEARAQFEVNVFGAAELIRAVLPHLRAQRSGTIINITSMGGKIYTPLGGWYHATKFALEALSDCLRLEVRPFGIDVVVIEPGSIRTEWGKIAAEKLRAVSHHGPYGPLADKTARSLEASSAAKAKLVSPPACVADTVVKAATAPRPRTRYTVGFGAKPLIFLRGALPDRAFDRLITAAMGALN